MNFLSVFDCKISDLIIPDKHDDHAAVAPDHYNPKYQTKIANQN
jgi:hypothetical protein